jgi:DNA-binding CsgD family transcriptional regulator
VAILLTIVGLDVAGIGHTLPIIPRLLAEVAHTGDLGWRIGAFLGLYALMQFACSSTLGSWSDRIGRRPVLLLSLAGATVDYVLMAVAPWLSLLFLGRAIAGVTGASQAVASAYITDVTAEDERAQRFGPIVGPVVISEVYFATRDYLSEKALSRSTFHQEFVIPNGSKYQASWMLHNEAGLAIALTLHSRKSPFNRSRLVRLNGLAQHARQAARISVRIAAEIDHGILLRQALDATNGLCVMVDAEGRIIDQSMAAEALLAGGQWLRVDAERRLRLRTPQLTLKLHELIARCTRGAGGGSLNLAHGGAEYPMLEVLPAGHNGNNPFNRGHGCSALVFLRLPRIRRAASPASLEVALNCTSAEAEVAAALAAGLSPQDIAIRRNVSVLTVRAQIRSLRALTNTPRMSALIALVNSLS